MTDSVSCASAGNCVAGGHYASGPLTAITAHWQAFIVSEVKGVWGTAEKAGKTVVCVLKLASGKGSCRPTATKLKAGTYHLTAAYAGNADFAPSISAARTLAVLK